MTKRTKKIRHLVIPDSQVKPDMDYSYMAWAGMYAAKMKPDVIIHIGDHFDMPSLSSYDTGTKSFEGRRYVKDLDAGITAMMAFMDPVNNEIARLQRNKKTRWNPRFIFTLGNHEYRIVRAIESDPKIEGLIGLDDLRLKEMGWEVYDFLQPVSVDGVLYCHYFVSGVMGRPVSSARALVNKKMQSCVMGHVQDRDIHYGRRGDGSSVTGLFAGIFYPHDEEYLNPQTNKSWRGIWLFNEVVDGSFDELPVSLSYLEERFGKFPKKDETKAA